MRGIGAEPEEPLGCRESSPAIAPFLGDRAQHRTIRELAEDVSAALAPGVGEIYHLAAVLTVEDLHGSGAAANIGSPVQQR